MKRGTIEVTTWDNSTRAIQQAEIRAEYDGKQEVFFKIEGRCENVNFMIDYSYDKLTALQKFFSIVTKLMDEQQKVLEEG